MGAGSAGCVLANRLSASGKRSVPLEAGKDDNSLIVRMPKGLGKLLFDTHHVRTFPVEPEPGTGNAAESWPRGRMLGGSSTVIRLRDPPLVSAHTNAATMAIAWRGAQLIQQDLALG